MVQKQEGNQGKRRVRLIQVLVFVALLALVSYGFSRYVLAPAQSSGGVPEYIGPLRLVSRVDGAEAMAQINRLHGTEITLSNAFIADYSGPYGGSHVMAWVGEAGSPAAAASLVDRMVKGINKGGAPFTNARQTRVAGRDVWQTDGKGGQFFFYISPEPDDRVVWLTIEGENSASLLEAAVKAF